MRSLFKPKNIKNFLIVLTLFALVKILWVVVEVLWLAPGGVEHMEEKGVKPLYYRVKLTPREAPAPQAKQKKPKIKPAGNIKDIKLLAIYNASEITVITVQHKSKTKVLSRGDNINGFVLEGGGNDFANFSKNGKVYEIFLESGAKKGVSSINTVQSAKRKSSKTQSDVLDGDITDAGDHRIIDQSLFDHYVKNMDAIYENIGITELKEGNSLKGFSISFIKKDSLFAKLGIRRGDMIKSVNGQEIDSYNAAFGAFKSIQSAKNLTLVIERRNEEMELEYEIN